MIYFIWFKYRILTHQKENNGYKRSPLPYDQSQRPHSLVSARLVHHEPLLQSLNSHDLDDAWQKDADHERHGQHISGERAHACLATARDLDGAQDAVAQHDDEHGNVPKKRRT